MMNKINWDLEQIIPIADFESGLASAKKLLTSFKNHYKQLSPNISSELFEQILLDYEQSMDLLMRLYARALLWEEVEQDSAEAKFLKGKVKNFLIEFEEVTRAFWLWVKGKAVNGLTPLDKLNALRLFESVPKVRYLLERERELAKHSLDNDAESIITNKDVLGLNTLLDIRALLETGIKFTLNIKGKRKVLGNISELLQLVQSSDPEAREKAYRALYKHYEENQHKYFAIYEAIVKNWSYEMKLRGYSSPINIRNIKNDIPDSVVATLLEVCRKNAPLFQRFFRLKAKVLGGKKLRRFDLYAPMPLKEESKKYSYEEALEIVEDVLGAFDADFKRHMQLIVESEHIDAFPDKHKISGAFCMTVTNKLAPYILLNYLRSKRDVMTLAHELGHGIHAIFSSKQSLLVQDAPLPLAETASTFSENLVFEKLYRETKGKEEKAAMLFEKLQDTYATILRQNYFVLFEQVAHERIPDGVRLEELHELYLKNLEEQFNGAVEIDPVFRYEWLHIPHIVNTPFYCYAYSFGELLALALYREYQQKGNSLVVKIKRILEAGGSENAVELLKEQGIDISKESFWQGSFDYIEEQIIELEKLIK